MFDFKKAASSVSAVNTAARVNIMHAFSINDRFARIVATAAAGSKPEQIQAGIRAQFHNVVPIAGSFVSLASDPAKQVFEGIVGVVDQRIVLTEENKGDYKAVASNMFMDADENLWSLKDTATGQILVKALAADDFAVMQQLMACASVDHNDFSIRDIEVPSAITRASVEGGDLLSYVSPNSATVEMAIAVAALDNEDGSSTHQLSVVRPNGQSEIIHRELIVAVAAHEIEESPEDQELATAANLDWNMISNYYARMFARRPAYYEAFMQRFRAHAFM